MIAFLVSPLGKAAGVVGLIILAFFGFRIWLHSHDTAVLAGYVKESELTATKALLLEAQRQSNAASQALSEAEKRKSADEVVQQAQQAQTDQDIADYEKRLQAANRACTIDSDDLRFLQSH